MNYNGFYSCAVSAALLAGLGFTVPAAAEEKTEPVEQTAPAVRSGLLWTADLTKQAGKKETALEKDPATGVPVLIITAGASGYSFTERIPKALVAGKKIVVRADMEQTDVAPGKQFWETVKLQASYRKAGAKHSDMKNIATQSGTVPWRPRGYVFSVPADIEGDLSLMIGLQNVSGTLKLKNIQVLEYVPVSTDGMGLTGSTEPKNSEYKSGEEMVFRFTVENKKNQDLKNYLVEVERSGDDGKVERMVYPAQEQVTVKSSIDGPGVVRVTAKLLDADGIPVKGDGFCMSAYADFEKILPGVPEPEDFDAFWDKQKAGLAEVPLKVLKQEKVKSKNGKTAYDVQVSCAGKRPVSGYLVILDNAAPKSLSAKVVFQGYGATGAEMNFGQPDNTLVFQINAHGYPNGLSRQEYAKLGAGKIFDNNLNQNPETAYFKDMFLRAMRAIEYVRTLPEWNGKSIAVEGGSQGGLQAIVAAGLMPDQVTSCYAFIPWCCDLGGVTAGRMKGWRPDYTPALRYFDPVYHAKRMKCPIGINAGLADYVCPPSGIIALYNNITAPKRLRFTQGMRHGGRGTDSFVRDSRDNR